MKSTDYTFEGSQGNMLSAQLDLPDEGDPLAYALFAHCFTCSRTLKAVNNIARVLTQNQLGIFRFDFAGLGRSSGNFSDTNFTSNIEDIVAASLFMSEQVGPAKILIGHSLGGAATLQAAQFIPDAVAVATIGAPSDPEHVTHMFSDQMSVIESEGESEVTLAGRPFTIKQQFVDDLKKGNVLGTVSHFKKALMVCHAPFDNTVGIENAADIFLAAKHPKSFVSLDDADHLLTNAKDAQYVGRVIATLASKYI